MILRKNLGNRSYEYCLIFEAYQKNEKKLKVKKEKKKMIMTKIKEANNNNIKRIKGLE